MHDLFTQVLSKKDLSKAGDLFSVADQAIVNDLTEVVNKISEITSLPDYINNDNDQSVVEICITRVTSAIRETGSMEQHAEALVGLLESCLNHNLKPSEKDEDPPHAKISSDIISCIFLNYRKDVMKKDVMKRALPVAVKFLHKGNKELSRNMASYLSLAAIDNADLLSEHIQLIIDSIISGNYPLCRVLPQIYEVSKEPIHDHVMALVSLLPLCEHPERLALLQLFSLIASNKPVLLEPSLSQLSEHLAVAATAGQTMEVLLRLAENKPHLLADCIAKVKQAAETFPSTVSLAAQVVAAVGRLSQEKAQEALNFILEQLGKAERGTHGILIREAKALCSSYPVIFSEKMIAEVRKNKNNGNNQVNQMSTGGVTIVKVGGQLANNNNNPSVNNNNLTTTSKPITSGPPCTTRTADSPLNRSEGSRVMITPRPRLGGGDSRSTSRLHSSSAHRSMTRLNMANFLPNTPSGSGSGLHKSMTRLPIINNSVTTIVTQPRSKVSCGGVTVTTNHSPTTSIRMREREESSGTLSNGPPLTNANSGPLQPLKHSSSPLTQSLLSTTQPSSSNLNSMLVSSSGVSVSQAAPSLSMSSSQALVTPRRSNTSVTIINHNSNAAIVAASQRISVFEPYPMRDTIQHFCEKHLDKIKTYMENVSEKIPLPAKCTIEENTRAKKMAKLQFGCDGRGEHCLYSRTLFTMRSRNPRIWIHFMFLSLQAKSQSALSSRHPAVTALKYCWDILKCENKPFVTLVTSAFPCARDQEAVINELQAAGFCDVFEYSRDTEGRGSWGCFLCNHPERAVGFLHDSQPVIEGQLKEKKGRWRMFRRWRTRYFTLSGARLEYKGTKDDKDARPIDIHQIRSVKVSRGARNIPKAFEIFTGDNSLILKPKDGTKAEEWVQCLSVVVAHSQAKEVPTRGSSLGRSPI